MSHVLLSRLGKAQCRFSPLEKNRRICVIRLAATGMAAAAAGTVYADCRAQLVPESGSGLISVRTGGNFKSSDGVPQSLRYESRYLSVNCDDTGKILRVTFHEGCCTLSFPFFLFNGKREQKGLFRDAQAGVLSIQVDRRMIIR
ncbi:hypothetical protein BDW66DRAFT_92825 [Aspergillus desertorum]